MQGRDKMDKCKVGKCKYPSSNSTNSVASTGMLKPPVDCLSYSTFNSFEDKDYIHNTEVMRLHIAARDNNTNAIKRSLEKGVSVYLPDAVGRSALHWAAVFCKLDTVETVIKFFPASRLDMGDRNGCTPLHYAVLAGRADVANMLLKAGCHVHSVDNQGRTPLHYSAQNANASLVLLLLKRGADLSSLDKLKRSPYDVAKQYSNTQKIIECLRLENSNTPPEPDKPKLIEHRHKQSTMKTKAVKTNGKVSITFYSVSNMEAEELQQNWQAPAQETEEEKLIRDTYVEIVKEEMERDAERMKYKLYKIRNRKEPPSEEKMKKQEQALQQLVDRFKKNAMEKRRKMWAEEERLRQLTRNRTRSATQETCCMAPSFSSIQTSTKSTMEPFQTSHRPSNATSLKDETEELIQDEWQEETWTPGQAHHMEIYPQTPVNESHMQNDTIKELTERKATEHVHHTADAVVIDHQVAASTQQMYIDQDKEQGGVITPPCEFPASVHEWFASSFPYPEAPNVRSLQDKLIASNSVDMGVDTPSPAPAQEEKHTSLMGPSSPPLGLVNVCHSTEPSKIPGERNFLSPTSTLSSSSYKSPASPQWDVNSSQSHPTMNGGTTNSTPPSSPLATNMEPNARHTDASTPVGIQKEMKVLPGYWIKHTRAKYKDGVSYARKASKNPKVSGGIETLPSKNCSLPQHKLSHKFANSQPTKDKDDPFASLGYAHSFRLQKNKSSKSVVEIPPNRHGLQCFSHPKVQKDHNVHTSEDHRLRYSRIPWKQPWSPDEPWRHGGISKTVTDSKMYGLLKTQGRKSMPSIRSLYHMTRSNIEKEDIDSDPFAHVKPQEDEAIDRLPLAKLIHQQEALWSLREPPQASPEKSDQRSLSSEKKLEGVIVVSPRTKHSSFEAASTMQVNLNTTSKTDQGQGMLLAQRIDEQTLQSYPDELSQQHLSDTFLQTTSDQLNQTIPTLPVSLSVPSQVGLKYATLTEQEHEQVQPNCTPTLQSDAQQQLVAHSRSCQIPRSNPAHRPNSWLPHQNSACMLEYESQTKSYRKDDLENRLQKRNEMNCSQQRCNAVRPQSQNSIKPHNCSLERSSPERLALMNYHGQSVRPQFLGLGREQPPVHQCIDVKSLIKQWL